MLDRFFNPTKFDKHLDVGIDLFFKKQYERAIPEFEQALNEAGGTNKPGENSAASCLYLINSYKALSEIASQQLPCSETNDGTSLNFKGISTEPIDIIRLRNSTATDVDFNELVGRSCQQLQEFQYSSAIASCKRALLYNGTQLGDDPCNKILIYGVLTRTYEMMSNRWLSDASIFRCTM